MDRKRKQSSTPELRKNHKDQTTVAPFFSNKKQRTPAVRTITRSEKNSILDVVAEESQSHRQTSRTKYANKYEPEIPMLPEDVSAWRREARRKRNRESAEKSRNKVRNRISELEDEVENYKERYKAVLVRIQKTEQMLQNGDKDQYSVISPTVSPTKKGICHFLLHSNLESHIESSLIIPSLVEPDVDTVEKEEKSVVNLNDGNVQREVELDRHIIEITTRPE